MGTLSGRWTSACAVCLLVCSAGGADETTFYIVRHAEKTNDQHSNPPLSKFGRARAEQLRRLLDPIALSAIYATTTLRAQQTAAPTAEAQDLDISHYEIPLSNPASLRLWAANLVERHRGKNVLIVGHSNTVGKMAEAISGESVPRVGRYSDLLIVSVGEAGNEVRQTRYGWLDDRAVRLEGALNEAQDLSAVALVGGHLAVASDETHVVQVLTPDGSDSDAYRVSETIELPSDGKEIDIEGLAFRGGHLYILGSHAWTREAPNRDTYKKNQKRIAKVDDHPKREVLYRVAISPETGAADEDSVEKISLRGALENQEVLVPFQPRGDIPAVPAKENGIDLEGLASAGERLYVGFRGPVLARGFTPVLTLNFDQPDDAELVYVALDGQGIRSMTAVQDGFLIVAGAVGDAEGTFSLHYWDGKDCLPGERPGGEPPGRVITLTLVPTLPGANAEGITVMEDIGDDGWSVLVLYDGLDRGGPRILRVPKPVSD